MADSASPSSSDSTRGASSGPSSPDDDSRSNSSDSPRQEPDSRSEGPRRRADDTPQDDVADGEPARDTATSENAASENAAEVRDESGGGSGDGSESGSGDEESAERDDSPATLGTVHEPQRLHPLTLLQRLLASLPAFVLILFPVLSNPTGENLYSLIFSVIFGVVALPAILLQYYRFSYRITEKQIIIQSGVFNRKNRSIPIERVQNVQIEQNLLARVAQIAKVKIETAGSSGAEGVLEYVGLDEANRIRSVIRSFQRERAESRSAGRSKADQTDTASSATRDAAPDTASAPEATDPEAIAPEATAPEATAPEATAPEATAPEAESTVEAGPASERDRGAVRPDRRGAARDTAFANDEAETLFQMSLARVLLSGAFRFSFVYIAVVFSVFQFVEPETLFNYVLASKTRFQEIVDVVYASPFLAGTVTVTLAIFVGWLTGIVINLNRYYGFHLWLDRDKLRKRHGLFTVTEGTIPIEKVQALILRTNPFMKLFGWHTLEVQTVGIDVNEQGHRVVVPFAQLDDLLAVGKRVRSFDLPDTFRSVSPLTIRRSFFRYTVTLSTLLLPAAYFYPADWWHPGGVALPWWAFALTPLLLGWAVLQYRHHGFDLRDDGFYVRRGVLSRYTWILPTPKFHVFYTTASVFQRRLGLQTLFVDTAGAANFAYPEVVDVEASEAQDALHRLRDQFQTLYRERIEAATGSPDTRLSADERPQLPDEDTHD